MRGAKAQACRGMAVVLMFAGCRGPAEPREVEDDLTQPQITALHITPVKATWSWDEVAGPDAMGLRASIHNGSTRVVTSILGDKFLDHGEQVNLFIDKGGSGTVEWRGSDGVWREVGLAPIVEGVKSVILRPTRHYTLSVLLRDTPRPGLYRIRVDYADAENGERFADYSGVFEIR